MTKNEATTTPHRRAPSRRQVLSLAPAAAVLALLPALAQAAAPRAAVLDEKDYADVRRVQDYLNDIHTMQSRFEQISPEGGVAAGTIYVQRPGKMRIVYDPPVPILMVSDGWAIYYVDEKLQQVSQIGVEDTPAWFLLRPDIHLGGDVTLTRFERAPGVLRLTIVETKKPESGSVTMVCSDRPLQLRQWMVIDAQNRPVTVTLVDPHFGLSLNPSLFVFDDPRPQHRGVQ